MRTSAKASQETKLFKSHTSISKLARRSPAAARKTTQPQTQPVFANSDLQQPEAVAAPGITTKGGWQRKQEAARVAGKRRSEPVDETFGKPVRLPQPQHYEDDTTDVALKERVPRLRKIVQLKDAEERRNKDEVKRAQLAREQLGKQAGSVLGRGRELEIADMGITYDYEGKVLKIERAQNFSSLNKGANVDSALREDLTEVKESEAMLALRRLREEKLKKSNTFLQSSGTFSTS